MKNSLITFCFLLVNFCLSSQDGYEIKVHLNGMGNDTVLLAHHFGTTVFLDDTTVLSSGKGVFKGKTPLHGGMYVIVFPDQNYIEFLLGDDQHFKLITNTEKDMVREMKVVGSRELQLFYDDLQLMNAQRSLYESLNASLEQHKGNPDSVKLIKKRMEEINDSFIAHRKKLVEENPELLYTKFLLAVRDPEIPEPPRDDSGHIIDSLYTYKYYKKHYWDHFDFNEDQLAYTRIYHQKLKRYITQVVSQHPDSIIAASDYILKKTRPSGELFKYSLTWLLNKHASSKIMGMDAVYVHLVENYYMKGDAPWVGEEQMENIIRDALLLSPNLMGRKAKNLVMKDREGNWHSLYDVDADYTILYFWDADCGHCRKETPRLKKLYDKYGGEYDIEVYAVSVEFLTGKWEKFIDEHDLNWINVIDPEEETKFRSYYNIRSTPMVYLLDKDKKIIAKRIDVATLENLLRREWGLPSEDHSKEEEKEGLH